MTIAPVSQWGVKNQWNGMVELNTGMIFDLKIQMK